jgi:hypothetical protein
VFEYDKSSKWLLQHHGNALLTLAGVGEVKSWRALQAEVVQPRQLPDGLLEVQLAGASGLDLYVLELATYPDARIVEQVIRDMLLVYLDRRVLPEVVVIVLHPKGNLRVPQSWDGHSRMDWSRLSVGWRVVELWNLPADAALATGDPGIVPWVPLMQAVEPPEAVFQNCREIIDQKAAPTEQANLLAVTQVFAGLRYNDPKLLALFGGRGKMIESPVLREFLAEGLQRQILAFLDERFGTVPADVTAALQPIQEEDRLQLLARWAARCPDLAAFRARLTA